MATLDAFEGSDVRKCFHCPSVQTGNWRTSWICLQYTYWNFSGIVVAVHPLQTKDQKGGVNHHPCLVTQIEFVKNERWGKGKLFG